MSLFNKSKNKKNKQNLKGRVQCNESCQIIVPGRAEPVQALIHEFNWLGFVADHIDLQLRDLLKLGEGQQYHFIFKMPREFGSVSLFTREAELSTYLDVLDDKEHLRLEVNLENTPEIEVIREFVSYRNRRFSRHQSSRKSLKLLKNEFILKWFIFFPALLLALAMGALYAYHKLLGG